MKSINRTPLPALITGILWLLCGCSNESCISAGSSGALVAFSILLQDTPGYNSPESASPSTRNGEPLLSEWVKVNTFSATRSGQATDSDPDSDGPRFAAMELFEDTGGDSPQTRSTMQTGIYFRLIVFKKSGSNYVFQSVADYASDGSSAPVLKQGDVKVLLGQTVRFVAYSFNNGDEMGSLPASYTWKSTSIPIPDLTNDFLTYDSGDVTPTSESMSLGVSFIHRLCRLTVQISATGFSSNTFSNCTGVYVKQGGSSSSWTVGGSTVSANTGNTATFNIPDNSTNTFARLVPFASARAITTHFGTLTLGGKTADNIDVTSSQSVQLQAGKSYTMTVRFKKTIGTRVAVEDIQSNPDSLCTDQDKVDLAQLTWADGNLKSTDNTKPYVWAASGSEYGYYYTWKSTYTGDLTWNNTDPCSKLDESVYGVGWRYPHVSEFEKLVRCSNLEKNNGGMWFMNPTVGLFLPAAGRRSSAAGSGTEPLEVVGVSGYYWAEDGYNTGYLMFFNGSANAYKNAHQAHGFTVRCVKGAVE